MERNNEQALENNPNFEQDLPSLLNGIGKRVFIEYYNQFKSNDDPTSFLVQEGFTKNSERSRASKARYIFRNNLELEALQIVIDSIRTEKRVRDLASAILIKERSL
jgi:hypothetical protein